MLSVLHRSWPRDRVLPGLLMAILFSFRYTSKYECENHSEYWSFWMRNNIPFSFTILAFLSLILPSSLQCLYVCNLVLVRDENQRRKNTGLYDRYIIQTIFFIFIPCLITICLLLSALDFHFNVSYFRFDPLHKFGFLVSLALSLCLPLINKSWGWICWHKDRDVACGD